MTKETYADNIAALYPELDIYSNLIYLLDKDPEELVRKYHAVKAEKNIVAAYSIAGRHCLVLFVNGKVKKVIKKTRSK